MLVWGSIPLNQPDESNMVSVQQVIIHPQYNQQMNYFSDIALLKLAVS